MMYISLELKTICKIGIISLKIFTIITNYERLSGTSGIGLKVENIKRKIGITLRTKICICNCMPHQKNKKYN